jgi:hypothetical protein
MEEITTEEIGPLLRGRMGLIIGPGMTKFPGCLRELRDAIAEKGGVSPEGTLFTVSDSLLDAAVREEELVGWIREKVNAQKKSSVLTHLVQNRWAAVLSAAIDPHFEDGYRQHVERKKPAWPRIAAMADPSAPHPSDCIPSLKLLGAVYQDDFAYSTATYLTFQARWRVAVRTFIDLVKANPVLCVGLDECPDVLHHLLREFLADRTASPARLVFLSDDPIRHDRTLLQLARQGLRLMCVRGTAGDVCRAATSAVRAGFTPPIPFPQDPDDEFAPLRKFRDLATVVNEHVEPTLKAKEITQLLDLLFAPSIPRWDAQAHGLDFPRTQTATIYARVCSLVSSAREDGAALAVIGPAASGKTMLLKRLSLDLARAGNVVLWLTPWAIPDRGRVLNHIFDVIAGASAAKGKRIVVVIDDPVGCGALTREVTAAAKSAEVSYFLLTAVRTTDWLTWDRGLVTGNAADVEQAELHDDLDEAEWAALPEYLTRLGIARDASDAVAQIDAQKRRGITDTLSVLYFLLPHTRGTIAGSVRQEYSRLDDPRGLRQFLIGGIEASSGLLKKAYEFVAVANHYRANLPMEVLVAALRVDYQSWVDATPARSAAWGFLYPIESEELQTVVYRTRNEVVTSLVVEMLNGGHLGHSGELPIMRALLEACGRGSNPAYLDFCRRVLVPYDKLRTLSYEEGLQLYETAATSLRYPDRTLLHHHGLWIKNQGKDPIKAITVLTKALDCPPSPQSTSYEADEHIHNSLAAANLDAIKKGRLAAEDGKGRILGHVAKARSADFFNAQSVHVEANLIAELIDQIPSGQPADLLSLLNRAVSDIDRTLLTLNGLAKESPRYVRDIEMLQDKKAQLLQKVNTVEELEALAEQVWGQFRSQEGFVLVVRKMFALAMDKGKKFDRPFVYAQRKIGEVETAGETPSPALVGVAAEVYYSWQMQRVKFGAAGGINWRLLADYTSTLLAGTDLAQEPFYRYLNGLSLAHLDDWPEATAAFAQLRKGGLPRHVTWARQDQLRDDEGNVRVVQGTVKEVGDRRYLFVEQLQRDFYASRTGRWPRPGQIAFATIDFTYSGPTAYPADRH